VQGKRSGAKSRRNLRESAGRKCSRCCASSVSLTPRQSKSKPSNRTDRGGSSARQGIIRKKTPAHPPDDTRPISSSFSLIFATRCLTGTFHVIRRAATRVGGRPFTIPATGLTELRMNHRTTRSIGRGLQCMAPLLCCIIYSSTCLPNCDTRNVYDL